MTPNLITGYNVHRPEDREAMLAEIGVRSIDELFEQIPHSIRLNRDLAVPGPMTEWNLGSLIRSLACKNSTTRTHLSFLGGGAYHHFIPATVDTICNRGELLTAYTPYQPEMSQGLLQILFEYQQLISTLFGLPSVNCSLYDGATALAEGAWMACQIRNLRRIIVAKTIWPQYMEVLLNYMKGRGVEIGYVNEDPLTGLLDKNELQAAFRSPAATLLVQSPNAFGILEDLQSLAEIAHSHSSLFSVSTYPIALGILRAPGHQGADIVTCEGQSLGIPLNAGGPYLGILATHKKHERFLPGRLVGRLTDLRGNQAYALIKEDREQHASREKATSHICSNQAHQAMRAAVYLTTLGEKGFLEISLLNAKKARYFKEKLVAIQGVSLARRGPFFNEFALNLPCSSLLVLKTLETQGIFGGISLGKNGLLVNVTELHSRDQLDKAAQIFEFSIADILKNSGKSPR